MCTLTHTHTLKHKRTHRVDSRYNVLIGWNLNNTQAKQSDSQAGVVSLGLKPMCS